MPIHSSVIIIFFLLSSGLWYASVNGGPLISDVVPLPLLITLWLISVIIVLEYFLHRELTFIPESSSYGVLTNAATTVDEFAITSIIMCSLISLFNITGYTTAALLIMAAHALFTNHIDFISGTMKFSTVVYNIFTAMCCICALTNNIPNITVPIDVLLLQMQYSLPTTIMVDLLRDGPLVPRLKLIDGLPLIWINTMLFLRYRTWTTIKLAILACQVLYIFFDGITVIMALIILPMMLIQCYHTSVVIRSTVKYTLHSLA